MDEWLDLGDVADRIQDLLEMGLDDDAEELLETYRNRFPPNPDLPLLHGRIYLERDEPAKAIPHLLESRRLDPTHVDTLLSLFTPMPKLTSLRAAPDICILPDGRIPATARLLRRASIF